MLDTTCEIINESCHALTQKVYGRGYCVDETCYENPVKIPIDCYEYISDSELEMAKASLIHEARSQFESNYSSVIGDNSVNYFKYFDRFTSLKKDATVRRPIMFIVEIVKVAEEIISPVYEAIIECRYVDNANITYSEIDAADLVEAGAFLRLLAGIDGDEELTLADFDEYAKDPKTKVYNPDTDYITTKWHGPVSEEIPNERIRMKTVIREGIRRTFNEGEYNEDNVVSVENILNLLINGGDSTAFSEKTIKENLEIFLKIYDDLITDPSLMNSSRILFMSNEPEIDPRYYPGGKIVDYIIL